MPGRVISSLNFILMNNLELWMLQRTYFLNFYFYIDIFLQVRLNKVSTTTSLGFKKK